MSKQSTDALELRAYTDEEITMIKQFKAKPKRKRRKRRCAKTTQALKQ